MNDPQEAGMQQQQEQKVIGRVGFEALLDKFVPNWQAEGNDPKVRNAIEFSRAIYLQGLTDASVFINTSLVSLAEGHNWLLASAQNVALNVQQQQPVAGADEQQQASSTTFFADTKAVAADAAQSQPVASTLTQTSASSTTDSVPHNALRGETSSMQHMDTLGHVPAQGKGGTHDGAGASGDWDRDEGPNPAKFANDARTIASVDSHQSTSSGYATTSHTTADSSHSSAGSDSGGSCDSGGGSSSCD